MAINVSHNVPAQVAGGLGQLAGNANFLMQMYPQLVQQDQFAKQMQQRQDEAVFQAAQQQYAQQQAQAYQLEQQARQQRQQQALLAQQNQAQLQNTLAHGYVQSGLMGQQQAFQDQQGQYRDQARMQYDLQHQGLMLDRQQQFDEAQRNAKQAAEWQQKFYDPFSSYDAETQKLTKSGLQFTPESQQQQQLVRQRISKIQEAVSSGNARIDDVMPQFKTEMARLTSIRPTQQTQTPQEQWAQEAVPVFEKRWTGEMDENGQPQMVDDPTKFLGYATAGQKGWSNTIRASGGGKSAPNGQPGQPGAEGGQAQGIYGDPIWDRMDSKTAAANVASYQSALKEHNRRVDEVMKQGKMVPGPDGQMISQPMTFQEAEQQVGPMKYNPKFIPPQYRVEEPGKGAAAPGAPAGGASVPEVPPYTMNDAHKNESFVRGTNALAAGARQMMDAPDVSPETIKVIMGRTKELQQLAQNVPITHWPPELQQANTMMVEFARKRAAIELQKLLKLRKGIDGE